jgi:hypothetical protein
MRGSIQAEVKTLEELEMFENGKNTPMNNPLTQEPVND